MKELYASLYTKLTGTYALTSLLGTATNVWHGEIPADSATPCVAFDLWSSVYAGVAQPKGNREPQIITLRFTAVAKDGDHASYGGSTLVTEITEQLKEALHGALLSTATLRAFQSVYDDFQSPALYDEGTGEWRCDCRFRFWCKKA